MRKEYPITTQTKTIIGDKMTYELNEKETNARARTIERFGNPVMEYYSPLEDCYLMIYEDITFGIESDGYTHS